MKSAFRATAILGGSSVISAGIAVCSAKAIALFVGPSGLGYVAAFQSVLSLTVMVAGFGVGLALVRVGAKAISANDTELLSANWYSALAITIAFGILAAALIFVFRNQIAARLLADESQADELTVIALAVVAVLLTNLFLAYLSAHHRVAEQAKMSVVNTATAAILLIAFVAILHGSGIAYGIAAGSILSSILISFLVWRIVKFPAGGIDYAKFRSAALMQLRFGLPYTASMVAGTGVQLALPLIILTRLGAENAGFYRAAAGISSMSLSLFLTALGQDYYPQLSSVQDDTTKLREQVNERHRLSMLLLGPIFISLLLFAPVLIRILYSSEFLPSVQVLRWVIVGDLFKSMGWVVSFVILARSKTGIYFICEAVGGIAALAGIVIATRFFGIQGAGMAYAGSYVVYWVVTAFFVRKEIGLQYDNRNKLMTALTAVTITGLALVGYFNTDIWFYILAGVFCLASCVASFTLLHREVNFLRFFNGVKFWQT